MTLTLHFRCMGCDAEADAEAEVRMEFCSFSGRGHGIGVNRLVWPDIDVVTPTGWVAFDPYTHVTYCQSCWTSITKKETT